MKTLDQHSLENAYGDVLILESWKKLLASAGLAASIFHGTADARDPNPQQIPLPDREIYHKLEDIKLKTLEALKPIVFGWKNKGYQTIEEVEEALGKGTIQKLANSHANHLFPGLFPDESEGLFKRAIKILLNTPNSVFINQ